MRKIMKWIIALCSSIFVIGFGVPCSHAYDFFLSPVETDNYASVEVLEFVTPYPLNEDRVQVFTNGSAEAVAGVLSQETALGSYATHEHGSAYIVQNGFFSDPQGTEWSRAELDMHAGSEGQLLAMGYIDAGGHSHTDYSLQILGASDPVEVLLSIDSSNSFPLRNQYITILDGSGQEVFSWSDAPGSVSIDQMSVFLSPGVTYLIDANSDNDFTEMSQNPYLYESSLTFTLEMGELPSVAVPLPGSALMLGSGLVTLLAGMGRKRTFFHG